MLKLLKGLLSCFIIIMSLSLSAQCNKWEDDLIANQKPQVKGNRFPVVTYHAWANHNIGGELEEKTTADISRAVFIVVPGAFLPTSSDHVKQFVDVYADDEHSLSKHNIPTYIVAGDKPPVIAAWAKRLGVNHDMLRFIPDHSFTLMSQLGVLDTGYAGLTGKTSVFYVEDGQIVKFKSEEKYGEVIETSPKKVDEFVSKHWSSGLHSPRQEERVVQDKDPTAESFENLVNGQTLRVKGDAFPVIQYKIWGDNFKLEDKTTTDSPRAVFVVVPGAFLPTSSFHIQQFVDAYADRENPLRKSNIPTYVVSCDNLSVMEAWAEEMSATKGLLSFIPDQSYTLTSQLGVLEKDKNYGLIGKTSIFYVEDGKIIKQKFEVRYGDVIKTSPESAVKFVEKHWLTSPLSSPRYEEKSEEAVAQEDVVEVPEQAASVDIIAPEKKRTVHVGFSFGNIDVMNTDKGDREFGYLTKLKALLSEKFNIDFTRFKWRSPIRDQRVPKTDLVLYQLIPEEAERQGVATWEWIKRDITNTVGPNWAYMVSLRPGQQSHLCETLVKPENMSQFSPIFVDLESLGRWGSLEITDGEVQKTAATIAGYVERLK